MEKYPGHDTEFYLVLNGVVTGPLTGLEEVYRYNITPDTPVWYDGLDDWKPAVMAPLTRQIFTPGSEFHRAMAQPQTVQEPAYSHPQPARFATPEPEPAVNTAAYAARPEQTVAEEPAKLPRPYLIWAIVVSVIFNLVCGVIAIIYACKVKSKLNAGNIDSARRCSESAQWWIAGGITLGMIMTIYRLFTGSIF